jgi:hypothetical protein
MPLIQSFYLDAPTFSQATAVFLDAGLTICAPNGYYTDGTIARFQLGCVLQFIESCPDCGLPCDGCLDVVGLEEGYLLLNASTGETSSDVGAIVVRFKPNLKVSGMMVQYNSVIYNKFSSQNFGLLSGTANLPIFVGDVIGDCGIGGSSYSLTEYGYDGGSYITTGDTVSVTVSTGQVVTTAGDPGYCYMVIPKPTSSPAGILITNITPCVDTEFEIQVSCPRLLNPFTGSIKFTEEPPESDNVFCNETEWDIPYYSVSVNGNMNLPCDTASEGYDLGLYDWVFYDPYGQQVLQDGWYKTYNLSGSNDTIRVQNGVIIDIKQTCI